MGSQIGKPINEPRITAAQVVLQPGIALPDIRPGVEAVFERELAAMNNFTARLARGELSVW